MKVRMVSFVGVRRRRKIFDIMYVIIMFSLLNLIVSV